MSTAANDEWINQKAQSLGHWWAQFVTPNGTKFGGTIPIDRTKTNWIKGNLDKLGVRLSSAVDLGSYEGYHSQHLAEF